MDFGCLTDWQSILLKFTHNKHSLHWSRQNKLREINKTIATLQVAQTGSTITMGDIDNDPKEADMPATPVSASPKVICQEFLKVLGRKEVEQPMIWYVFLHRDLMAHGTDLPPSQKVCACAQFWRYQHYLLPLWPWGITKVVCFGLGSFRNVQEDGGPWTPDGGAKHTYRDVVRTSKLVDAFNARAVDRHDPLQAMLRHVAAVEMASMMKFCSSRRGIEHGLIKQYFKKLAVLQDVLLGEGEGVDEKVVKKLGKLPVTAGYAGDEDLTDVPVYLCGPGYTVEDREALGRLAELFRMAHLPPVEVLGAAEQEEGYVLVDEHTLVYSVDAEFPVRRRVLERSRPAAMIWRDHASDEG